MKHEPTEELLLLDPDEILPPKNDSRHVDDVGSEAEAPDDELSFAQLVRSIRATGLLQPISVRRLDGSDDYELVFGRKRLRAFKLAFPEEKIPCRLRSCEEHAGADPEAAADFDALLCNLTENHHRTKLNPWELAETYTRLREMAPAMPTSDLARLCGVSADYCLRLIRVRKKLRPDLWNLYKKYGHSLRLKSSELDELTRLPHAEQLVRWNELVEAKRKVGGGRGRGPEKQPRAVKLEKFLAVVGTLSDKPRAWREGCAYALKVALGEKHWQYGTIPLHERRSRLSGSR